MAYKKDRFCGYSTHRGYLQVVRIKKFLRIRVPHANPPPSRAQQISRFGELFENLTFFQNFLLKIEFFSQNRIFEFFP
jgi:hypothetical protein